jgi:succinyl-diaminopimelate desuccinylase
VTDAGLAERLLERTLELVRMPSVGRDDAAILAHMRASLPTGLEVVDNADGAFLAVPPADGGPLVVLVGHVDTVPPSGGERPSRDGDAVVGRGAADMKGPIAAALAAASALRRAGTPMAGSLVFHLAADEELAGIHGTKVLWERGLLTQDAAIVGEPSELQVGLAERGGAWFTATAYGTAAHGSQPERGVNAITSMARFLLRLPEVLPDREHPLVGSPSVNAALIAGGSAPNVVPDRCEVDIDRRIVPGETDPDEVRAPFLALVASLREQHPEVDIQVALREWTDAAEASPDTDIARIAADAVAASRGARPALVGFTGITDARFYINLARIPTVICGPGSLTVAHTANESVPFDELVAGAQSYARMFAAFLGA